MDTISNPQLELALNFAENTGRNIFLTGKAGTGKTTFLHNLRKQTLKRTIVVAPTGVAAINAGGVTIHSFFQLAFGPHIPDFARQRIANENDVQGIKKFNRDKINIIRSLDLLVIDEISMVRADMLDAVDETLRRFRERDKAFGGVQLFMIGDIQQLAPVVKDDEWDLLRKYYDTMYFFSSKALQSTNYISIELKHIYRQADQVFVNLLNKVRENKLDRECLELLNTRYIPAFEPNDSQGYITLTTHNATARDINTKRLEKLLPKQIKLLAETKGEFPEYMYPTDYELLLKTGAQVMFVKNDPNPEKQFYNGKIGKVHRIDDDVIFVQCPDETEEIAVTRTEWQNLKYTIDDTTKEITETVIGTFVQFPLKLAWAITIHKSQGLTFKKAIIDANASFAHGQVYVALSRCTSLEGIVLSSQINEASVKNDQTVTGFSRNVEQNQPDKAQLDAAAKQYQYELLTELFEFNKLPIPLYQSIKLVKEHQNSLQTGLHELLVQIGKSIKTELTDVSEKFTVQLKQLFDAPDSPEKSQLLNERVKKASAWFSGKIKDVIISPVSKIKVETDNKAVRKSIDGALEQFLKETKKRKACLDACIGGFVLVDYLKAKALAGIDEERSRPDGRWQKVSESVQFVEHQRLFNTLKQWRDIQADVANVPVYNILQIKTITELSNILPSTLAQLKQISGIGKSKINQYGQEILDIINEYCQEQNIERPEFNDNSNSRKKEKIKKEPKENSKLQSFELFKQGKSIEEISKIRNFAISTIEGHLAYFVKTGQLSVTDVIGPDKLMLISNFYTNNPNKTFSEAKSELGDAVSWGELRLGFNHLLINQEYTPI